MKKKEITHNITLFQALGYIQMWAQQRFAALAEWKKTTAEVIFIVSAIWTVVWVLLLGASHIVGDPLTARCAPWQVSANVASWGSGKLKQAACWPIKKAVECCVPGLQFSKSAAESPRLWKLNGVEDTPKNRLVIAKKETVQPVYTVEPRLTFDFDGKCGSRWGVADQLMEVTVRPYAPVYKAGAIDGVYVSLTEATWDKVSVGDVLEYTGCCEAGAVSEESKQFFASISSHENFQTEPFVKLYGNFLKAYTAHVNNVDVKYCAGEKKRAAEIDRERKEYQNNF